MSLQEAKQFVAHFVNGDYSPEEYATFLQWLRGATSEELNAIADEHEALHERWSLPGSQPSPEWVAMLEGKLDELGKEKVETPVVYMGIRRRVWVAAASVVVLLSAGAIWYTQRSSGDKPSVVNGQGSVVPVLSQTLENPAGSGQKEFTLADGSKVWLNAASTLKYPAVFTGPERVVELSGEAFFEVNKSAGKPFRVLIKDAEVEVLGTHFDIMAYENEPISKTTLIDGVVRLESDAKQFDLKPGDQAVVHYSAAGSGEPQIEVKQVQADAALSWRKGYIDLTDADLQTAMRALKRYYNVDIQYSQGVPETHPITVGLILQDGLQHNLEILEGFFQGLHFKSNGKIVTVTH
ncbi:MAG TPA: FecR domain-containing protein [Puia sp.]|nr:FecR domain-containing protein [Puia sp.]